MEDAKRFYQPDPIIRKGLEDVMINAENLLKDVYYKLFPDIEDIVVNSLS